MQKPNFLTKRIALILSLIITGGLLSGCSGGAMMTANSWPGALAVEGKILVSSSQIFAVDPVSGNEIWRFPAEADRKITFFAQPAITSDGDLIAGSYNNHVYRINGKNGSLIWDKEIGSDHFIGAPVIAGELALLPNADGNLYAVNLESGSKVWAFSAQKAIWAAPVVDEETVYLGSLDHYLYAVRLDNGQERWSFDAGFAIADSPTISDGLILVGTFGNELFALDKNTGRKKWSIATEAWVWSSASVHDGKAYFGDMSGNFYIVETHNGALVERDNLGSPIATTPLIHNDSIYILTEGGSIYARELETNQPLWQISIEARLLGEPAISNDTLFVTLTEADHTMAAVNVETGSTRWLFAPEK